MLIKNHHGGPVNVFCKSPKLAILLRIYMLIKRIHKRCKRDRLCDKIFLEGTDDDFIGRTPKEVKCVVRSGLTSRLVWRLYPTLSSFQNYRAWV
jgi:hypothetical protein